MTAATVLKSMTETARRTAVIVSGRAGLPRSAAPDVLLLRSGGRRRGAIEAVLEQAVRSGVEVIIVPSLSVLHPAIGKALALAAMLKGSKVTLRSTAEPWLADVDPQALAVIAAHLQAVEASRASRSGRTVISRVRATGHRVGRPKKEWDRARAEALVAELGSFRKAAAALGIGCTTLRRGLKA